MIEALLDALLDTLKTIPILYLVYLAIELMHRRMHDDRLVGERLGRLGPVFGALLGCVPQCGFSSASAALYNADIIKGSTLVAVFLATSDEAIPILLAHLDSASVIVWLILCKLIIAVIAGYILRYTVFAVAAEPAAIRAQSALVENSAQATQGVDLFGCGDGCDHDHNRSLWLSAAFHTLKIALFILATLAVINAALYFIGSERLQTFLLSGTLLQPVLAALLGLVPGCGTSVLLTELYLSGTLSFGSVLAGLSAGAGFGYIILFRSARHKKDAVKIVVYTFAAAVLAGLIVQLLGF